MKWHSLGDEQELGGQGALVLLRGAGTAEGGRGWEDGGP